MDKVRVVESPSGKLLVILNSGDMFDLAKTAASVAKQYPDHPIEASMDFGHTIALVTAEERKGKNYTSTDFFSKVSEARGGAASSYMFDAAQAQGGAVTARFNADAPQYATIYQAALDAALLSREFGGAPVNFEFRGRKVSVDGTTEPADIEKTFPAHLRQRADYVEPPRQFRSVKDQFNISASTDGVDATYKDPAQAQKHIWYVAMDLINLSHEFNGQPVKYTHAGHALSVTDKDDEKTISAKIPAADQWPGGPKR